MATQRLLARALYRQGRDQLAADVHKLVADDFLDAEDFFLVGQALRRKGQNDRAMFLWRKAIAADPNHVETIEAFVPLLVGQELLDEAGSLAQRLTVQPQWRARGSLLLAGIRERLSDVQGAIRAYQDALAESDQWHGLDEPDHVRKRLVRLLLRMERAADAHGELLKLPGLRVDAEASWLLARCALQAGSDAEPQVLELAQSYRESHLLEPEPAPYIGEIQCAVCHASVFRAQHSSRHARTLVHADQLPGLVLPADPVPDPTNPNVRHEFRKSDRQIKVLTQVENKILKTVFDYAFGSGDRGLTLVGHDSENRHYQSRLSFYPDGVGWDVTSGPPSDPDMPAASYQGMELSLDQVRRCLMCHATSAQSVMSRWEPEASDRAIGCERCHGPGGNHVRAVALKRSDVAIARPKLTRGRAIVALCAGCHSPRGEGIQLSPGADDSIRFQGTTLTWSRCYTESGDGLDCVTCHNPHRNVETKQDWYESRCLGCHTSQIVIVHPSGGATSPRPALITTKPCPIDPRHNCIGCHMPRRTTSMAHTKFTDHFIRVNKPD
jgi:tetratricopeptide (TPR) repeat protein